MPSMCWYIYVLFSVLVHVACMDNDTLAYVRLPQQKLGVRPMLAYCWSTVYAADPTLKQH